MRKDSAKYSTVSEVFGQNQIMIPKFQREYSWDDQNVIELWESITSVDNWQSYSSDNEFYFIGTLICYEEDDKLNIVDGQQRLTTLFLTFKALEDMLSLESSKVSNFYKDIVETNLRLNGASEDEITDVNFEIQILRRDLSRLLKTDKFSLLNKNKIHLESIFKSDVDNFKNEKLVSNYLILRDYWKKLLDDSIVDLVKTFKFAFEKTLFLQVNLKSYEEATEIFVSLNTNRKALTISDLLKTLFIKEVDFENIDDIDSKFVNIKDKVIGDDKKMVDFIRIYWYLKITEKVPENELYKSISQHLRMGKIELFDIFDDLQKFAPIYKSLDAKDVSLPNDIDLGVFISNCLKFLGIHGISQFHPLFLKIIDLYKNGFSKDDGEVVKLSSAHVRKYFEAFTHIAYISTNINKEKPQTVENLIKKCMKLDLFELEDSLSQLKSWLGWNVNAIKSNIVNGNWTKENGINQKDFAAMYIWSNSIVQGLDFSNFEYINGYSFVPICEHRTDGNDGYLLSAIVKVDGKDTRGTLDKNKSKTFEWRKGVIEDKANVKLLSLDEYKSLNEEYINKIEELIANFL